jgi:hypothetical protein
MGYAWDSLQQYSVVNVMERGSGLLNSSLRAYVQVGGFLILEFVL